MSAALGPLAFDPLSPAPAVLGVPGPDVADGSAPDRAVPERDSPDEAQPEPGTATATNRAGTVTVTATADGLPVDVRLDPRELRFGGAALSAAILDTCRLATTRARAVRREALADAGVPADVLDRLGLPTHDVLADAAGEAAPPSWMRPL